MPEAGAYGMPLTEKRLSLAFSCGRRGTAERWMRSRRAQSYSLSIPLSDFTPAFSLRERPVSRNHSVFREAKNCEAPWGFGLPGAPAQKKMDKGQYPLSAKRKCHTNIPAANILTLLPAAGARKGGFLKKAPFKSPKNFWAAGAKHWACVPN